MQIWQKANECLGFFLNSQIHGKAMPKDIRLGKLNCSSDSKHLPKNGGKSQNRISKIRICRAPKKKSPQNSKPKGSLDPTMGCRLCYELCYGHLD